MLSLMSRRHISCWRSTCLYTHWGNWRCNSM